MTLQVLREKGESNTAIAKRLGITEGAVRYHVRRAKVQATDGRQKDFLIERLGLQEVVKRWWETTTGSLPDGRPPNVQALWAYLVDEHQYSGSYKSVRRYVREKFPAPKKRPFRRIETPPGAQTQSDWLEATIDIHEEEPQRLYGFVMTLSHSRMTAVVWSRSMNQLAWHHVHNEAFRRLGGVAAVNRIDNLKTGVVRGSGPWGEINSSYQSYARTLGFHVDPHEVRQPQQKGKAERRVGVVKQLNLRQRFDSLDHLQRYTDERLRHEATHRRCPATGKTVLATWQDEQPLLRPLPATLPEPFDLIKDCAVHKDCTIRFEGRTYSVPFAYAYQTVEVRGCSGTVQIVDRRTGKIVKQYPRGTREILLVDQACYEGEATDFVERPRPFGKSLATSPRAVGGVGSTSFDRLLCGAGGPVSASNVISL
ncbi:MAG: IS21 family transposase [Planctomycetales bacterium]|nr:IS21 family transposase [Planctomycetales bacterium]